MRWQVKRAQRIARLISLREMGQLHPWITHKDKPGARQPWGKTTSEEFISKKKICDLASSHIALFTQAIPGPSLG